jgi:hypothetical protein
MTSEARLQARYDKWRTMGNVGLAKADRIWESLHCDDAVVARLSHELRVSPVTARLLSIRGLDEPLSARRFLFPSLDDLLDPTPTDRSTLPLSIASFVRSRTTSASRSTATMTWTVSRPP